MSGLQAFVLGYTGETGKALVKLLSRDSYFSRIVLIGRRKVDLKLAENEEKFEQVFVDFDRIDEHKGAFSNCKVGFCCIGTTRGKAGAKNFVKVDRDYVANSGRIAKEVGCEHFVIVSSTGADKHSFLLYPKTKGEVEELLKEIKFQHLSVFRPGLLLGDRQESRPMEHFFKTMCTPFTKLFPTSISVHFDVLAQAMINDVKTPSSSSVETYDNTMIHRLAKGKAST